MNAELPKNVTSMIDRHGRTRYRFRKAGLPARYIAGEPGTPIFDQAYNACLAGTPLTPWERRLNGAVVPKGESCVYFIGGEKGPVKIGTTIHLGDRLRRLQSGYPETLKVLAWVSGGRVLEKAYHDMFSDERLAGEWFKRSRRIITEMTKLARESSNHHRGKNV